MKRLALIVVLGMALSVPTANAMSHGTRLKHRVHHYQRLAALKSRQLRTSQGARAALEAQVAELQSELASSQGQVAALKSQLGSAQGQVATYKARLAAIPSPLEAAEQYVSREVEGAELTDPLRPAGEVASLAAMEYVETNVSFMERVWRLRHGLPVPGDTPGYPVTANSIFTTGAGQCAAHAFAFAALMRHLGYPVRSVSFYYDDPPGTPGGHTSTEVYYGGAWHYFDPSFDLYWTDAAGNVLDITTERAVGGIEHKANALLFNVIENPKDAGGGGTSDSWFETDPATRVVLDENHLGG